MTELKLFDKVRVKKTGIVGFIVHISIKNHHIIIEKDTDESDDKLVYELLPEELEIVE